MGKTEEYERCEYLMTDDYMLDNRAQAKSKV